MSDWISTVKGSPQLSDDAQKKMGQAGGNDMDDEHKKFLAVLIGLLDRKEIDAMAPSSFVKQKQYEALPEEARDAVDYALVNLADQIRHIEEFFRSKATPNASPELQSMIEHLWQMTSRLELKYGDVLKF